MSELPYWMQSVQALAPTVVAVIAALIAGYIALMQWRTAHYRLSFDMYEKRFAVYRAAKNFLTTAIIQGQVTGDDYRALYNGISGAEFLFKQKTSTYLMNIRDKAWKAQFIRAQHTKTDKLIDEEEDILKFLSDQNEMLEDKFKPYLDLSKAGLKSYWPGF
jgi:hypothetical protein